MAATKVLLNIFLVLYYLAFAGVLYGVLATGGRTGSDWAGGTWHAFFRSPAAFFSSCLRCFIIFPTVAPRNYSSSPCRAFCGCRFSFCWVWYTYFQQAYSCMSVFERKDRAMFSDIIETFKHMKLRTCMYVNPLDYNTVTTFIEGYDYGMRRCLLEGFYEWLVMKYGEECSMGWPYLAVMILERERSGADSPPLDDRMAIDKLFDLLEEFLLIKQDRSRGTRWIYAQYEQWYSEYDKRLDEEIKREFAENGWEIYKEDEKDEE